MRCWLLVLGLGITACGNHPTPLLPSDGGVDADIDAPIDAIDWSITIDTPQFLADPFTQHTVTIAGAPNTEVFVATDRPHAGVLDPLHLFLDASGHGTATYSPCSPATATCVGTATIQLLASGVVEATTPITIDDPGTGIGDSTACAGSDNVLHYRSTYYPHGTTTFQSAANSVWSVLTWPDSARFMIDGAQRLELSLEGIATPLAAGTYTNTQLSPPTETGRPAMTVVSDCENTGRFQIDELTQDPVLGTLQSITARFDEVGCDDDAYTVGCVHYVAPPVTPPATPPVADPAKLAVTAYQPNTAFVPDTTAMVIVTDATGTVVLDTTVDSFGFAQVTVIGAAELTVIEHSGGYEYVHTYRGVHAGEHVILNPGPAASGAQDQMLATWTAPPGAAVSLSTACGGGSWQGGNGLVDARLTFYDACRTPSFDMLAIAALIDGTQQWNWQSGLDHVANGNVTVPGPWADFDHATVTVSNVPASLPGSLATMWSMLLGQRPVQMDSQSIAGPPAGDVAFSLRYAPGAGSGTMIELRDVVGVETPQMITTVLPDAPASVSIDFAANPVPLLSQIQASVTGASWTETGPGTADMRLLTWEGIANNQRVLWYLEEPYDGQPTSVLPALPASHASDDPGADPAASAHGAAVSYMNYDVSSGFTLDPPAPPYVVRRTFAQTLSMSQPF